MISRVLELVQAAGQVVLSFYGTEVRVTNKADNSPLTEADQASHELLETGLRQLGSDWPVISEEAASLATNSVQSAPRFWLVDPLDGTKEFLKRSGEFTVNVALIEQGRPALGVVHAPALRVTWFAERNSGAFRQEQAGSAARIHARSANPDRLTVAASRDHAGPAITRMLAKMPGANLVKSGSSLKFCLVAEGKADLYLRDLPTMEWDTAAAQCVAEAARAGVYDLSGRSLTYGKQGLRNPPIMTVGDQNLPWAHYLATEK
jgi:3'(2'), 5'-bisphosphate nucleotidase